MKYTTESDAPDRNREEVRPGHPFIEFSTKPSVNVVLDNPIQMSGLFRVNLGISDGDTTKLVMEKVAKNIELKGNADRGIFQQIVNNQLKNQLFADLTVLKIWRYVDPVAGPRKIPRCNDYQTEKVLLENGTFKINVEKNEIYLDTVETGKVDIGTAFVYVVE